MSVTADEVTAVAKVVAGAETRYVAGPGVLVVRAKLNRPTEDDLAVPAVVQLAPDRRCSRMGRASGAVPDTVPLSLATAPLGTGERSGDRATLLIPDTASFKVGPVTPA